MAQVLVRNLDDAVVEALKARAELHGHSLEQELRDLLTQAATPTSEDRVAMAAQIRALGRGSNVPTDSTDLIRADRDAR